MGVKLLILRDRTILSNLRKKRFLTMLDFTDALETVPRDGVVRLAAEFSANYALHNACSVVSEPGCAAEFHT